ncbi:class I SAM-dependent methyltransferase [Meridianimarinicoccus aquatilis]|uniref:Class I SAM-dependent methyltransferase n=1 Tax=Meridianimarinicoccus aquatilis TaxID=2552766 RepID=A0A4R6AZZ5_9RHOB|nr:class I SAM-dependent methyltransferase [Fluviibacterium aquatile]TDL87753.1 class I SAM-dependent methyltransferase [Fluviibacterium aquatile]
MSGFSADWLALREPADSRSRSRDLIDRAGAMLAQHTAPLVCDLGSGTGAGMRAFAPSFPKDTQWLLTDHDPETLAIAGAAKGVKTALADLSADPAPWPEACRLVTATALFDLAAPEWINKLADRLAEDKLPVLACLTYDGRLGFAPAMGGDAALSAAFNRHQRGDKGLGGPAAGPGAAVALARALSARGYKVQMEDSAWRLQAPRDTLLMKELIRGWSDAMKGLVGDEVAQRWCDMRLANTTRLTIGHTDIFATPPKG